MTTEKILAHHAGARLYKQATGRFPSPEELAFVVNGGDSTIKEALAAYKARGDTQTATEVLNQLGRAENLGEIYQQLQNPEKKKQLGQIFTPAEAVQATLDLVGSVPARIIDPSCGAGDFLLASAKRWPGAMLEGIDIDPLVLAVAKTKLILSGVRDVQLTQGNALTAGFDQKYDLVVGNPPWGSRIEEAEVQAYTIAGKKKLNSFVYFLELAANLLEPQGTLAFVLPEAFIKVWAYQGARAWLLQRFAISGLHYIPKLFRGYYAPALLLSATLLPAKVGNRIPVWYQPKLNQKKIMYNRLPADALSQERFNINWRKDMEELWDHCCKESVLLQEADMMGPIPPGQTWVDFSLGIVTGSNKCFISDKPLTANHLPLLAAGDVSPFVVAPASRCLLYDPAMLQQAAPLGKYQLPGKILYRFISRELVAAVDYSGALTLNNLNIIIPLRLPFGLSYLVALLNSKLINTLYMYKFFTGKVLTRHIKQLPLRVGCGQQHNSVSVLAADLSQGRGDKGELDLLIYEIYGLSPCQRRLVEDQHRYLRSVFFV